MQIYVKTLTGRKIPFDVETDQQIIKIKEYIQEKEGVLIDQIRLIYSGRQLNDTDTINDYNIQPGSIMHMVLSLRGG